DESALIGNFQKSLVHKASTVGTYQRAILIRTDDHHLDLHTFPTRRSSDLDELNRVAESNLPRSRNRIVDVGQGLGAAVECAIDADRKSTRLNYSHLVT